MKLVNFKPILIIPGEKRSVFFEIFFKSIKSKKFTSPLILICNKEILKKEIKKYKFKKKIELINFNQILSKKIKKKNIYFIEIKNSNSKDYIHKCFNVACHIIKLGLTNKLINGPINKSKTLKRKYPGMTEYVSKKFNQKKFAMLIYNKKLSVSPVTTHLPLKMVTKKITKKLIIEKIMIINKFYNQKLGFKPKIGVVGLNPHCESLSKLMKILKLSFQLLIH